MEQNMPVIAKKIWHMVRVVFFMLRKGISKGKLMMDLGMMMKRGKIAGKAIQNLMFHHSHNWASSSATSTAFHRRSHNNHLPFAPPSSEYYEFSCSNSPAYPSFHLPFHLSKRKHSHHSNLFSCTHAPAAEDDMAVHAVMKTLEMLHSETASPALPGFGRSPLVRQLRITDSPFPIRDVDEDSHVVDEAAEEFISKFYKDLRRQNAMAALGSC